MYDRKDRVDTFYLRLSEQQPWPYCENPIDLETTVMAGSISNAALTPRPLPKLLLGSLVPIAVWFVVRPLLDPVPPLPSLYTSVGFSIFALLATLYLVPALGPIFVGANLKGRDLLKTYQTPMCVMPVEIISGILRHISVPRAWV
jgi:hypothetical protein